MRMHPTSVLAGASVATLVCFTLAAAPDEKKAPTPSPADMAKMMEKAKALTAVTPEHRFLDRFLGTWKTSTRIVMFGANAPAETGEVTYRWLIDRRWLVGEATGTMMGAPAESVSILGYDSFKKSYVTCGVKNTDNAMLIAEGDRTQDGETLITYGTIDEYLTGEHDKMVKYVYRFHSADKFTLEVHDLPIGETNTKVIEVVHTRS